MPSLSDFRSLATRTAALLILAPCCAQASLTTEAAEIDEPPSLRERLHTLHSQEAAVKERTARAWDGGSALRTPNQNGWDVHHYDLDLTVDPGTNTLSGTVTTNAEVTAASLTTMEFHFDSGMTVTAVTAGGVTAMWSHSLDLVTVILDRTYTTGEAVTTTVTYSGDPAGESFGWSSFGGADMIWTLSEPYGARAWWPCKDLAKDKADSVDIHVAVPDPLIAASNGLLQSTAPAAGWTTYHWKTNYPVATYLISLAIHPYSTFSHTYNPLGGGTMPVDYYVFPSHLSTVQATYALTVPMLDAFAAGYGEYPFVNEKYGHAEFVWGGGMEHQTLTSLGGWSEDLISHELAHQWWGDHITCRSFKHIWLNEGFATWSEAYWKEQSDGFAKYQQYMDATAYYGSGTIFVELPAIQDIFDVNLTYNKASWLPHMLRRVMGDTSFFAGLATYRATHGYDVATTDDFRDIMAVASGMNLDAFFQQWVYGEYYPVYRPTWSETTPGTIDLTIEQIQTNAGLFTMPIDVRVTTSTGTFDFVVQNSLATENYQLAGITGDVEIVQIDPDRWILREVETTVSHPSFDSGLLVVNGVDWDTYTTEITSAYADSVFWADLPFTFWDNFAEPSGGYPANLPTPAGHGAVPADVLGRYSAVVWVGNNYNGDLPKWIETPIQSYLDVGGNVLLLGRHGDTFLSGGLDTYLGITMTATGSTQTSMTAVHPSFQNVPFTGAQSFSDLFSTTVGASSTLLLQSQAGAATYGSGVIVEPPGGGTFRADGGKLADIAGRPYRMNHAALRANVETILKDFFGEPFSPVIATPLPGLLSGRFALDPAVPNPFRGSTTLQFLLPAERHAHVGIYDLSGRLVRTLVRGALPGGSNEVRWDGRDSTGRLTAAGVYFVRLESEGRQTSRTVVRLR